MRTASSAARVSSTALEAAQEERSRTSPPPQQAQAPEPLRTPPQDAPAARPSDQTRADARRAVREDATTRVMQQQLQRQLQDRQQDVVGLAGGPGANHQDDALEHLMNQITAEYGRSEHSYNPNNPDFPGYPASVAWEGGVRREIQELGHYAWYGSSIEGAGYSELFTSVFGHLQQTYTSADEDALGHATGYITRQLLAARGRWTEEGQRETSPPWTRGSSPEHGQTAPLTPDQAHPNPSGSPFGDVLGVLDGIMTVDGIASAALASAPSSLVGALGAAASAPISIGIGLWGLGRANQEHEFMAARGSERQALVHTLAYLSQNIDSQGSLPELEGLGGRMLSQYGRFDDTGPSGPPDPDAFETGVRRAHDYLERMSPHERLAFQAQLRGYAQDPRIGGPGGLGLDDYLNATRYQMGLWEAP